MKKIVGTFKNLKKFNWKLFIALCVLSLAPAIYITVRTFLISSSVSTSAFDVIGQMEWFDLIDETIKAFLIVPLYAILNKFYKNRKHFDQHVFKIGIITFVLYLAFSLIVYLVALRLVTFMNPAEVDIIMVTNYLRLETIAFAIGIIGSFVNVVFIVIGKAKNIYIFLIAKAIMMVISDFILIPNFGVYGVAYSNMLINGILAIVGIIVLIAEKSIKVCWFKKGDGELFKDWGRIGFFSGSESFVNNFVYALMICKMVNDVAEQGNYWVANNFIWCWLLIPAAALGEVIKRDCKDGYKKLDQSNYYWIILFIVIVWSISIPSWTWFYRVPQQLENATDIFSITIKLFPFYIAYGLSIIPSSIFIGLGKTKYSIISSLIINIIYYGIFFILYKTGKIIMNMNMIIIMFGFGMIFAYIIQIVLEKVFLKREMIRIER